MPRQPEAREERTDGGSAEPAVRRARRLLAAAAAALGLLLVVLPKPWQVPGGPGFVPPDARPFAHTVLVATWWACAVNAVALALLLAGARVWARPLPPDGPHPPAPARPRGLLALLLLAVLAAGLLRWPLAHRSFWWDEGWSLTRVVRGPVEPAADDPRRLELAPRHWARTIWYWKKPTNHVLYNVAARASLDVWRVATGRGPEAFSEFVFRLPAFAAGLAGVFGIGLLGWRWGAPRAGAAAAFLLALHPWAARWAVDGRAYAFVLPLTVAACLSLTEALRGGAWRHWLAYGAAVWLLLWTHPFMIYLVALLAAAALAAVLAARGDRRARTTRALRLVVAHVLAGLLLFQVMAPNFAQAFLWDDEASGGPISRAALADLWTHLATGLSAHTPREADPPAAFPSLASAADGLPWLRPLVFGGFPLLAAWGWARLLRGAGPGRAVLAAAALAPPAILALLHATGQLYYDRFLTFALVPLLLCLAAGAEGLLARLPGLRPHARGRAVAAGLAAAVALHQALAWPETRLVLTRPIAPLREVGEYLRARAGEDPLGVLRAGYGLGGGMPKIYDPWIVYAHTKAELAALCRRALREERPLYVFYGQPGHNRRRYPDGFALLDDPRHFVEVERFLGLEARFTYRILRFTGAPPDPEPGA